MRRFLPQRRMLDYVHPLAPYCIDFDQIRPRRGGWNYGAIT